MLWNLPNTEVLDVWGVPCAHSSNLIIEVLYFILQMYMYVCVNYMTALQKTINKFWFISLEVELRH